jgi:hypothetical protein
MEKVSDEQNPDVLRADCGTTLTEWRNKDEEAQAWKKRARSVHDRPRMHGDQL